MIKAIRRTLSTRVTPLAYLYSITGMVYGVSFTLFTSSAGVQNTILFKNDALVGATVWGTIALVSSALLMIGLLSRNHIGTQVGSLGMFMCWTFAGIIYATGGYFFLLLPLAVINALAYGYFYLASSINTLWDYTP